MNDRIVEIARLFSAGRRISETAPLGNGLINDTFLVTAEHSQFVLQRINDRVFPDPERVMANLRQVVLHWQSNPPARLRIPALLPTTSAKDFHIDEQRHYWRAWELIEHGESRENISRLGEAEQTGFALGQFHRLFSELSPSALHDTLPGFHVTPHYLQAYRRIDAQSKVRSGLDEFTYCRRFIEDYQAKADVLERAREQGILRQRIIHGDPKLNNFLFAEGSDRILSLIDLDTVKPGLVHYDIGDCLRSCCRREADNRFDLAICEAILGAYLEEAGHFFSAADYDYLYPAIELIPFELGLRFFTDYLDGNRYFKVAEPEQNLRRAADQFRLCEDIGRQRAAIEGIVGQLRKKQSR